MGRAGSSRGRGGPLEEAPAWRPSRKPPTCVCARASCHDQQTWAPLPHPAPHLRTASSKFIRNLDWPTVYAHGRGTKGRRAVHHGPILNRWHTCPDQGPTPSAGGQNHQEPRTSLRPILAMNLSMLPSSAAASLVPGGRGCHSPGRAVRGGRTHVRVCARASRGLRWAGCVANCASCSLVRMQALCWAA